MICFLIRKNLNFHYVSAVKYAIEKTMEQAVDEAVPKSGLKLNLEYNLNLVCLQASSTDQNIYR